MTNPRSLKEIFETSIPTIRGKPFENRKTKRFIKGPIPFEWIMTASRLSASALKVGLILWFLSGLTKSRIVKFSNRYLKDLGLHRSSKYKALHQLQKAGLISYTTMPGSSPIVTLIVSEDGASHKMEN